ncbi:T9SS type B sorting domain-containing protein [Botryobacter ruber]|uniref:T9SS type B sorting domain-containing protein n=1 Tax=Botryobacter ruber TaxID=2171629 RepID=UPI000E09F2AC|nr:gliding motility-associated C-terminal domain-containing protein [Botryobacter ruber]
MKKFSLLFLLLLSFAFQALATHIVGGEFELRYVSGNTYRLSLNLYFDLVHGDPGARDETIMVGIYEKGTNTYITTRVLPLQTEAEVLYTDIACAKPGVLRTSKLTYYDNLLLPPALYDHPAGYYVVWERCCRNGTITNIVDPGGAGQAFYMEFPPVVKNGQEFRNSSPILFPPLSDYACLNELFYYDFSGTDPNGDSLVYDLVTPLNGSSTRLNPAPAPSKAPYAQISWIPGYSQANQVMGSPSLTIHPNTGRLTVRPSRAGLFVFGIRCQEFRNGEKIGEVRRDFQLMVRSDCKPNVKPVVKALEKGKSGFYAPGEVLQISPTGERCIEVKFTDPDPSTRITLKTRPVNFSNNNFTLSGVTSGTINTGTANDTLTASLCFDECFDTEGRIYEMDLIATDNGCSQPKLDTLRLRFMIEPVPDAPPAITLSTPDRLFSVQEGDVLNFNVIGTDTDGDIISITARGVGFELGSQQITFENKTGVGPLTSSFSWPIDCQALQNSSYKIEFTVTSEVCGKTKTTTEVVDIRTLYTNNAPVISTDQQVLRFDLAIDQPFEARVFGNDIDLHELLLAAAGQGFNLADYGMTFEATGGAGSAEGTFKWVANCAAAQQGTIRVDFLLKESACVPSADQKLTLEFNVAFPNTPPVISTDQQELVFELDLHEAFEAKIFGKDEIDLHQLLLAAAGQGFNLKSYGMKFEATGGAGNAEGLFSWVANCEAAEQGVVRVDFVLQETACVPSPDQKLTLEFRIKVPDTQNFIPANIFTPNGDGLNDYFEMPTLPQTTCKGTFERITVYNRWGKEVYSSTDSKFRWDGRNVNAGAYYYLIDYSTTVFKGTVTIVH